ncbi:hypothetical protein N5923_09955 [Erwiniaceae bacterium BAC15a-03b]|uniref:Uncharacterized protein n=1 Tax=Winslowiella arboricola TaxID=2978220 RepID=A0A9J6PQC1_9GAMM|nr:hypothetical protein [Winslowiella arboricola]MCU5773089.1 hypothetical protein [Winslowiella arboricola]MCU5777816.1 hypothetical protein [Winslowiella arboricola]
MKRDIEIYCAYSEAVRLTGRGYFEIATRDFVMLAAQKGFPITPAEANKYIREKPHERVKLIDEGAHGFNNYRFTH